MATLHATRTQKSAKQKTFTAAEWREILQHLAEQITGWAQEEGWAVQMTEARVLEGYPYPPTLVIEAPQGRLMLELPPPDTEAAPRPILYAWPALYRVRLQYGGTQAGWEIWADSRIPLRRPWGKETFITLAKDLLRADE